MNSIYGVVTATRAEYGLFYPLLKRIEAEENLDFQLFVTGTHLSYEFGFTKKDILDDGFNIVEEIDCVLGNDTPAAIGKTSGLALMGLAEAFNRHKPDKIILLGDRYETLCAAIAATLCRIPIIHLYGGEITEGAYDDGFRHAITKLSHFHFTSTEEYRKRVIQLGEPPDRVFNVGALGLDNALNIPLLQKTQLEMDLGIKFKEKNILLTIHPETLGYEKVSVSIEIVIRILRRLEKKVFILVTGANADSEGRIINNKLKEFCDSTENALFVNNLGMQRYLSVLNNVDIVLGNSSSGIVEVPSFGIPTVNIGNRQKGRICAESIINVSWNEDQILNSVETLLKTNNRRLKIDNPYGNGCASEKILKYLKCMKKMSFNKEFFNINFDYKK